MISQALLVSLSSRFSESGTTLKTGWGRHALQSLDPRDPVARCLQEKCSTFRVGRRA
ncbi:MAG: hypothetical protein O7I93_09400 [Gemmatimonadetes bacterium]|nr:hypothetical protein [Gemmatimonadota bacterium]